MKISAKKKKTFISLGAAMAFLLIIAVGLVWFYTYSDKINEKKYVIDAPAFSTVVKTADSSVEINAWHNDKDKKDYLFLPYDADISTLSIHSDNTSTLKINGTDTALDTKTNIIKSEGEYKIELDGKKHNTVILKGAEIPSLHIATQAGGLSALNNDKSFKESATIRIFYKNKTIADKSLKYIKGRGNRSWEKPQKSYNIKFKKKIDLFDMGEAKKYSLIANYTDLTLMKNYITYNFADKIGLNYVSDSRMVDLYIDNNYLGSYLIAESIEPKKSRVDINDLDDANEIANPNTNFDELEVKTDAKSLDEAVNGTKRWVDIKNNPDNIKDGYILELELTYRYIYEKSGFVSENGQPIVLKSPEYATEKEVEFVSSLYQEFEDALFSENGYNELGRHYTEYIDLESFAKMYLVEEFSRNGDAHCTSTYMYLDESGILKAGPVWDFDFAYGDSIILGNMNNLDNVKPEEMLVCYNGFFRELFSHSDFRQKVSELWNNEVRKSAADMLSMIDSTSTTLSASAVMNGIRWNRYLTTDVKVNTDQYISWGNDLKDFVNLRIDYFDKTLTNNSTAIFYNSSKVYARYQSGEIKNAGDTVTVIKNPYDSSWQFI